MPKIRRDSLHALGEHFAWTVAVSATEALNSEVNLNGKPLPRQIPQPSHVAAVARLGYLAAFRTGGDLLNAD
jgi:hypothetical protein